MTEGERLGLRTGILDKAKTSADARYDANRCLHTAQTISKGSGLDTKAAECWKDLARLLFKKAERLEITEERRRIRMQSQWKESVK